jgi:tRNA dimethylallyltransferase
MMGYDKPLPSGSPSPEMLPLIVIAGPTGSGKTALALYLANRFEGEIVNCDSLQLYRGFDIGTAKTAPEKRQGIPHHLFDVLSAEFGYSAGEYSRAAREVLAEISLRGRLPLLVGGTGFYLRALLAGLPSLPPKNDSLRIRLAERELRRTGALHKILSRLDPESAVRIHANDTQKLIRAVELRLLTLAPRPASESAAPLSGYRTLSIGLDPEPTQLRERLKARTREMFATGLVEEVRDLLGHGLSGNEKPFEALGYKQALQVLRGQCTVEQAIESTIIATRQYAKRQRTWFRRDPAIHWVKSFGEQPGACNFAAALIEDWLAKP